jgi:hypothetical protein
LCGHDGHFCWTGFQGWEAEDFAVETHCVC